MLNEFSRTQLLLGQEAMEKLARSRVAVFGIGGVGGYTVEALARSGVGALDLVDDDKVCLTNINRQLLATRKTVGKYKADVAAERVGEINPRCEVRTYKTFYLPETAGEFDFSQYDYVVDAIDTVSGKIQLVLAAQAAGTPIISSMGAGKKLDATAFRVADITQTSVCPLARVMRRELKKRGVRHLKVVYSTEKPIRPLEDLSISCRAHCICPPGYPRLCGLRAVGRRADHRGRSGKGYGEVLSRELGKYQLVEQSISKKFRKTIWRPFVSAVKQYELIQAGDRIAVCISGGKDSFLDAKLLQMLRRHSDVPFELVFLVMDPGYNEYNRQKVEDNARLLNIPIQIFDTDIFDVTATVGGSPCYLCARMRRGSLGEHGGGIGLSQSLPGRGRWAAGLYNAGRVASPCSPREPRSPA